MVIYLIVLVILTIVCAWMEDLLHKFNFRISNFRNSKIYKFIDGLTEFELEDLNRLYRVWDSGKMKFIKTVNL